MIHWVRRFRWGPHIYIHSQIGASLALAFCCGLLAACDTAESPKTPVTFDTGLGAIVGFRQNGIAQFRGIRYAEPPTGTNRFMPPVPASSWSEQPYDATRFANRCPQQPREGLGGLDEDCLSLNIYTPSNEGDSRAVLVWIHGGGYNQGSGHEYNGTALARQGDVVVVTINYRLSMLGFVDLSALGSEFDGSANNGVRDQILTLTWVRDNIRDYGGDPGNVTIFGESAGGGSVLGLLAAPAAEGLFHKAMASSPTPVSEPAEDSVAAFAEALDTTGPALLTKLRAMPAAELVAMRQAVGFNNGKIDGLVVTRSANEAIRERGASGIPLVIGTNRDEGTFFSLVMPESVWPTMEQNVPRSAGIEPAPYLAKLRARYGDDAEAVHTHLWTDLFRIPALGAAEAASGAGAGGWLYRFDLPATVMFVGEGLGATHAAEVPFTFNSYATGVKRAVELYDADDPAVKALAERWSNTVIAFAKTGDPNGAGLPEWPQYRADDRKTLVLDANPRVETDLEQDRRQLWESLGITL